MESFADAQDAPIVEIISGQTIQFPLLTIDEYALIGRELQAADKGKALASLGLTASKDQRERVMQFYDTKDATVDDICAYVFTPAGTQNILKRSLNKVGVKTEDAAKIIKAHSKQNGFQRTTSLAIRVSALFPPVPLAAPANPPADPKTGDVTQSSSSESAASVPAA